MAIRKTALSMTVAGIIEDRKIISQTFKRLRNLNALAMLTWNIEFRSEIEFIDSIFWSPMIERTSTLGGSWA